jgi:hypothetical protein
LLNLPVAEARVTIHSALFLFLQALVSIVLFSHVAHFFLHRFHLAGNQFAAPDCDTKPVWQPPWWKYETVQGMLVAELLQIMLAMPMPHSLEMYSSGVWMPNCLDTS